MILSDVMPHFIEGVSLFLLLLSFGGLAWMLDRRFGRMPSDFVASGFLLFVLTFVLSRWFGCGPRLTSLLLGMCTLAGLVGFTLQFRREPRTAARCLGLATLFTMIYALAWLVPVNPSAVDPKHYAMNAAWAMQDDWFWANFDAFADLKNRAKDIFSTNSFSRLGCAALSFIHNPLGLSIDLGTIQREQIFMLALTVFVAFGAFFRHGTGQPILRIGLAVLCGGIVLGKYHLVSSLIGGQVNQTLAILLFTIVLSDSWEYLETGETPWRSMASCFLLPGVYPETVWMIPFIFLTLLAIVRRFHGKRILIALVLGIVCTGLNIIYQGSTFVDYLIYQSTAKPGWWPLGNYKGTVLEIFSVIACGGVSPKIGSVLLVLIAVLTGSSLWFVRREPVSQGLLRVFFPVGIVAIMTCCITLAISKTGNENYAVFKMAGWFAPLLAFGVYALGVAALRSQWPLWWRCLTLLIVFGMAGASWMGSLNFLREFPLQEPQASVRFVTPPPAELEVRGLYDPTWVAELAPWRNIPLRKKDTK